MYQILTVAGDDADAFLQGQLTQDVGRAGPGSVLPAAWCNPKGRVISTMGMTRHDDVIDLIVPADIAKAVCDRLSMYVLRSKVSLLLQSDSATVAVAAKPDLRRLDQRGILPELVTNSCRRSGAVLAICTAAAPPVMQLFGPPETLAALSVEQPLGANDLASSTIRAGQIVIGAAASEKFTPHMLSLDLAGAVSFDKGCYTGQEIVARTEHLGNARRRLMRYECSPGHYGVGDKLTSNDQQAGTVVNASRTDVLAVTPVALHGETLLLNGVEARPAPLPWQ